jgi:hypothetical protein
MSFREPVSPGRYARRPKLAPQPDTPISLTGFWADQTCMVETFVPLDFGVNMKLVTSDVRGSTDAGFSSIAEQ